jgi:hypothetical protein
MKTVRENPVPSRSEYRFFPIVFVYFGFFRFRYENGYIVFGNGIENEQTVFSFVFAVTVLGRENPVFDTV